MEDKFFEDYGAYQEEDKFGVEDFQKYEEEMKLQFLRDALAELDKLDEEEACTLYNTETKEEARQGIIEYWT